jgi:hypothetical protein
MNDKLLPKVNFWAYDIFGYSLPGMVLFLGLAASNSWLFDKINDLWTNANYVDYVILAGVAYTFGHVVSGFSSYLLERLILRHLIGYPTSQMFKSTDNTSRIVKLFFPGYFRPYSAAFQDLVRTRMRKLYSANRGDYHDFFWLAWSHVCANHPVAYYRATHFLELYGFSRNMSMTFLLLVPSTWFPTWSNLVNGYLWSFGCLGIATILFLNYTKLLRRLNDEVYRAFVVSSTSAGTTSQDDRADPLGGLVA